MKNKLTYLFLILTLSIGCNKEEEPIKEIENPGTFSNPILAGFNPDPSICRVGEDYYMVTSSFAYFPGIPILHSKDLVNWEQIGAGVDRTEQMDLSTQGFSRGLFAPAISYHDGWFYIVCTLIDNGGNFVIKSQKPEGPYSEPVWLPALDGGIDPSLFFDENGKIYIVYNHGAPNNEPLYQGHRSIRLRELDKETLQTVGQEFLLVNGGGNLDEQPIWIEAPHIYQKGNTYYLMCAEGGTGYNHSEVLFKSETVTGGFVPYDKNPILTQRHLDKSRPNPVTTAGHADIVELPNGEWWAVFLACRPYEGRHFNTGRETFLTPVRWEGDWFTINPDFEEVQYEYPSPQTGHISTASIPLSGAFSYRLDFDKPLDKRWMFLRNIKENWYNQNTENGTISLQLRPETIAATGNPSLLCRRQSHLEGEVSTYLEFEPEADHEMAGLAVIQNDKHYYFINKKKDKLQLLKKNQNGYEIMAETPYAEKGVHLKIEAKGNQYNFLFSKDEQEFTSLLDGVDAKYLSTETAGGFVGVMYGLYASANGEASNNQAIFDYFAIKTKK